MKKVLLDSNESSFRLVKNVGVFILTVGVIGLVIAGLIGLILMAEDDMEGFVLLSGAISFFLLSYFAFGICKGLSELVMNSYFNRKLSEAKAESEGFTFDEVQPERNPHAIPTHAK